MIKDTKSVSPLNKNPNPEVIAQKFKEYSIRKYRQKIIIDKFMVNKK